MNEDNDFELPFNVMAVLQQRLAQKTTSASSRQSSDGRAIIDPYQLMLQRREHQPIGNNDYPIQSWPEEDVKQLEDFCRERGIFGFNAGNMNPLTALHFLKKKLGLIDDFPTSENSNSNSNYPYTENKKRQILLS